MLTLSLLIVAFTQLAAPPGSAPTYQALMAEALSSYQRQEYEQAIVSTQHAMTLARVEYGSRSLEFADAAGALGALYRVQAKDLRALAASIRSAHGRQGPHLGIESEVFFREVDENKQRLPSGEPSVEQKK